MIISEEVKIDIAAWVVSLEDKRFFKHSGIDHLATIRAITMYALGRAHGGASTIEMQLWRTITGRKERTIVRKITEAKAARQISKRMDKLDTLEIYCDIAFASTSHYSMRSTLRSAAKALMEPFPDRALFVACLLKYPLPAQTDEDWGRKIRARYEYGLKRAKIKIANAQRIREVISRRRELSKS